MAYERDHTTRLQPPSIAPQQPKSKVQPIYILRWCASWARSAGLFILIIWLLAACSGPLTAPTPLPLSAPPSSLPDSVSGEPAEALAALIQAEREASIDRNLAMLEHLWASDARIVDGRNTAETSDDYIWAGWDAIMDRYVVAVFPNPPPPLNGADVLQGLSAKKVGENMATGSNGGDRWQLIYIDDRWWLQALVYQQP